MCCAGEHGRFSVPSAFGISFDHQNDMKLSIYPSHTTIDWRSIGYLIALELIEHQTLEDITEIKSRILLLLFLQVGKSGI